MYDKKESFRDGMKTLGYIDPGAVTVLSPTTEIFERMSAGEELPEEMPKMKLTRIPSVRFSGRFIPPGSKRRLKVIKFQW